MYTSGAKGEPFESRKAASTSRVINLSEPSDRKCFVATAWIPQGLTPIS
jgi:hypothetical protein